MNDIIIEFSLWMLFALCEWMFIIVGIDLGEWLTDKLFFSENHRDE